MSSKSKVLGTAVAATLVASTILPPLAEAKDADNYQGKKLEVHTAPMSDLERKVLELKAQVDSLIEPSNRISFPWAFGPFGLRMLGDIDSFDRHIDRLAGNALWSDTHWGSYLPRMKATESEKELKITAEVPGIDENHLDVSVRGDTVTIKGQKEDAAVADNSQTKRAAQKRCASFERTFKFPYQMDSEKAEATLKNGVLTVVVPKLSGQQPEGRKLAIRKE